METDHTCLLCEAMHAIEWPDGHWSDQCVHCAIALMEFQLNWGSA